MSLIGRIHGGYVHARRVRVLLGHLSAMIPPGPGTVLDVGCGDGLLACGLQERRPELRIEGVDVLVRSGARIPVKHFDGRRIPADDGSFDTVLFVDVLHHVDDPSVLLREAARVSRSTVILKDHLREGWLAGGVLRCMDWVGNSRHGVVLPYNYQTGRQWEGLFGEARLRVAERRGRLGLYPGWADWLFGRGLHFIVRLDVEAKRSG